MWGVRLNKNLFVLQSQNERIPLSLLAPRKEGYKEIDEELLDNGFVINLDSIVLDGGYLVSDTLGCDHGGGHLIGGHGDQLDGPVHAPGRDVGVAVVHGHGVHARLEAETFADLLSAEVILVDGGLRTDYQTFLSRPTDNKDDKMTNKCMLFTLGILLL